MTSTWCRSVAVTSSRSTSLAARLQGVDAVIHLAGANRGPDDEVLAANVTMAEVLRSALTASPTVTRVVYANSTQSVKATAYGQSKAEAESILSARPRTWTTANVVLPNLFGEHGRPDHNSFVATFCQSAAVGEPLDVHGDNSVELLHAQEAARAILDAGPRV